MAAPTVTIQATTDIETTTARGHGKVTAGVGDVNAYNSVSFGATKFNTEDLPRAESVVITNV